MQAMRRNQNSVQLPFCPHLISSLVLFICLFCPCACTRTDVYKIILCVCVSVCTAHFQTGCRALASLQLGPPLRLQVPHFSVPFAEVDTVALHTGWASIILSYCKVICIQTKLRKSNLFQECQINLGGRGPWQCTAGAKLAWLHHIFFSVSFFFK